MIAWMADRVSNKSLFISIDIPEPRDVPALVHEMWKNDDTMMQEFPQRRNYDTKIPLQSSPVRSKFFMQPMLRLCILEAMLQFT